MNSWHDTLPELNEALKGPCFVAGSPGYEDEVAVFNQGSRPKVGVKAQAGSRLRRQHTG